jgi:hypothetical protein
MKVGDKVKIKKDSIQYMENMGLYRNSVYTVKGLIYDYSGYGGIYAIEINVPGNFPISCFYVVKSFKVGFFIDDI